MKVGEIYFSLFLVLGSFGEEIKGKFLTKLWIFVKDTQTGRCGREMINGRDPTSHPSLLHGSSVSCCQPPPPLDPSSHPVLASLSLSQTGSRRDKCLCILPMCDRSCAVVLPQGDQTDKKKKKNLNQVFNSS